MDKKSNNIKKEKQNDNVHTVTGQKQTHSLGPYILLLVVAMQSTSLARFLHAPLFLQVYSKFPDKLYARRARFDLHQDFKSEYTSFMYSRLCAFPFQILFDDFNAYPNRHVVHVRTDQKIKSDSLTWTLFFLCLTSVQPTESLYSIGLCYKGDRCGRC